MEILDDQQFTTHGTEQLSNPLFLSRIRIFSIITLVHAGGLFVLSILIPLFFLVERFILTEIILLVYSSLFALLGAVLLFRVYYFINKYLHKGKVLSDLARGMNHFFIFWIVLTFGFLLMIGFSIFAGF